MRFFTGHFERSLDAKNRLQLPSQLRDCIDPERDGAGLYVRLGDRPGTLSLHTERGFEVLAERMRTEYMQEEDSEEFEFEFYATASHVECDKQGRFVLPDRLVTKAGLKEEVVLVGQKTRIDIWSRDAFESRMGGVWTGDRWPNWKKFTRMRPDSGGEGKEAHKQN